MSDDYDYSECDKLFEKEVGACPDNMTGRTIWRVKLEAFRACYRLLRPENVDYAFNRLVQRLGDYSNDTGVGQLLRAEAADAIRQQAERIAELERADDITMTGFNKAIDERNELQSQLSAAQQRLERWEGQQVILYMCHETANTGNTGREGDIALIARLPDNKSCHRSDAEGGNDEQITRP